MLLLITSTACQDEFDYRNVPTDGTACVNLEVEFKLYNPVSLDSRASGDIITHIDNIWILVYDMEGNLHKTLSKFYDNPDTNPDFTITETREGTEEEDGICKATLKLMLPFDMYRIIAIANYPAIDIDSTDSERNVLTLGSLSRYPFPQWDQTTISNNKYMSGWFSNSSEATKVGESPEPVTISSTDVNLHCWLRRAVSKVTVSFDTSNLLDNITIYLESIEIKDIPKYGPKILENSMVWNRDADGNVNFTTDNVSGEMTLNTDSLLQGEKIRFYHTERPKDQNIDPSQFYDASAIVLTSGKNGFTERYPKPHAANSENSLFFYENMQGKGKDKSQIDPTSADKDLTQPSYPDGVNLNNTYYKDSKPGGTYIEVKAFYVSTLPGNVGQGEIVYRFMLGKDVTTDYNAERNHHYKLTLKFNGYANDVDWHIEYDKEIQRGVYVPHVWVSYLYNQPSIGNGATAMGTSSYWEKCYPIRLTGNVDESKKLIIRIIESNWYPDGAKGKTNEFGDPIYYEGNVYTFNETGTQDYYKPRLSSKVLYTGIWSGFFSLYVPAGETEICNTSGRYSAGEYLYWYGKGQKPYYKDIIDDSHNVTDLDRIYDPIPKDLLYDYGLGYREYDISKTGVVQDDYGFYKVEKSGSGVNKEIIVYIPIFTRALEINGKKAFSGGNPFFSYQRTGKIKATATFKTENSKTEEINYTADVTQVKRITNPKMVMRSHDNTSPFTVTLMHRDGETQNDNFKFFESDGSWRATLISNDGGWRMLGSVGGMLTGKGGTVIRFTVQPTNTINIKETRCAIVKVEYHNYHCVHYIHLRQGYAPIQLDGALGSYWHTFNLAYVDNVSSKTADAVFSNCPLEEGGMFTYGNFDKAIDPINNVDESTTGDPLKDEPKYTPGFIIPDRFQNISGIDGKFVLSPVKASNDGTQSAGTWANVSSGSAYNNHFSNWTVKFGGEKVTVPRWEDYNGVIFNNPNVEYGFGLAFADGADNNVIDGGDDRAAFRHVWFTEKSNTSDTNWTLTPMWGLDDENNFGMRVCVVYDINTYNAIPFPIGYTGFGRRRNSDGNLRYGDFTSLGQGRPNMAPMLYNLYTQYGAVYWLDRQEGEWNGESVRGMDFNYSSYDFGPFFNQNLFGNATVGDKSDAVFVRMIQSQSLTDDQILNQQVWDRLSWKKRGQTPTL